MSNISINKNDGITNVFITEKRETATEVVIKTIKKLLVTKKLLPGDRLPSEMELSQGLGVSRGSVREAMRILSAYGIVNIKRGDGTYIADTTDGVLFDPLLFKLIVNKGDMEEFKQLREMIELGIIKLAIENATDENIKELENVYEHTANKYNEKAINDKSIIDIELKFHTALGKATGNKSVQTIYNFVMELYIPNIYKDKTIDSFGKDALECHRPIIDAIINRDIKAGEAAIKHSVEVWKYMYDNFKEDI